jgi:deoxyribodipyrimidine photolyase-related protein
MNKLTLILGNQLFPYNELKKLPLDHVFMAEDVELCTHFKYHKHKIIFFLSSMRSLRDELQKKKIKMTYHELDLGEEKRSDFCEKLQKTFDEHHIDQLHCFEIEDKFFEERLTSFCHKHDVDLVVHSSPMFLVSREEFQDYLGSVKRPFMKTFYERQRKHFSVLVDKDGKPEGGAWSFDQENRKKWPKNRTAPPLPQTKKTKRTEEVIKLVDELFADHPGQGQHFWPATTRKQAKICLETFIDERLEFFGDYQDALTLKDDFLYHSILSPYINAGLLTPQEVVDAVIEAYEKKKAPLNSVEGFVRQVLGWREFVRGIYQEFDEFQQTENFWDHQGQLGTCWYEGETGIPPLDSALQKSWRYGHAHHIERLMVLSNMMLLCEIHPQEVYRWFMEMYVDSSDWVMGPNVFGMGQFSDGGIFATKPYICGSNYWLKMGRFPKGEWTDIVDGLYWRFIAKHRDFFSQNPRLSLTIKTLDKIPKEKKDRIFRAAEAFIDKAVKK